MSRERWGVFFLRYGLNSVVRSEAVQFWAIANSISAGISKPEGPDPANASRSPSSFIFSSSRAPSTESRSVAPRIVKSMLGKYERVNMRNLKVEIVIIL